MSASAAQTAAPSIPVVPDAEHPGAEKVTPQPPVESAMVSKEEKIEYRDQDGNLLNDEDVKSLEGKVSFQTRYETRTRIIDANGNEIDEGPASAAAKDGVAPPHPDADDRGTSAGEAEDDGKAYPATASPEDDIGKEKSVEKQQKVAKPASEGVEATKKKDEL